MRDTVAIGSGSVVGSRALSAPIPPWSRSLAYLLKRICVSAQRLAKNEVVRCRSMKALHQRQ